VKSLWTYVWVERLEADLPLHADFHDLRLEHNVRALRAAIDSTFNEVSRNGRLQTLE
jgi:hypothetical protein